MATAKRLQSGNYRVRVYDKDTKKYKSFTAKTKKEAELMAAEFLNGKEKKPLTEKAFFECIDDYIKLKSNILSPTTVDKYKNIKKNQLSEKILNSSLSQINQNAIQEEINKLSGKYSPKTVHNAHGLISAVLRQYYPDLILHTTLPQKQKTIKELPSADKVIQMFKGTDIELAVLLALWCGLRMSEIRGLKLSDFKNGNLTVNRVIVDVGKESVVKDYAKTTDSHRQLQVPIQIQDLINKVNTEYIVPFSRKSIYQKFKRVVKKNGYNISFHDLRHLNASIMLALGVPDKYAMERGGWSTNSTLKNVYQQTMSKERKDFDKKIDTYFSSIYDTKYDTKINQPRKYRIVRHI